MLTIVGDPNELVDVVDENDIVVGTVTRAEMRRRNLRHRGVAILVRNTAGELLIHRRSASKDVWPGMWDIAAGGAVSAGESYLHAATRELAEELGIHGAPLRFLSASRYEDDDVRSIAHLFEVLWDGDVRFDDDEVVEAIWVSGAELEQRLERDAFVMDSRTIAAQWLTDAWPCAGGETWAPDDRSAPKTEC